MFELSYNLPLSNGLTEHEYGHVYFAVSDDPPRINPEEAEAWRYSSLTDIQREMHTHPERFTLVSADLCAHPGRVCPLHRLATLSRFLQINSHTVCQRQQFTHHGRGGQWLCSTSGYLQFAGHTIAKKQVRIALMLT